MPVQSIAKLVIFIALIGISQNLTTLYAEEPAAKAKIASQVISRSSLIEVEVNLKETLPSAAGLIKSRIEHMDKTSNVIEKGQLAYRLRNLLQECYKFQIRLTDKEKNQSFATLPKVRYFSYQDGKLKVYLSISDRTFGRAPPSVLATNAELIISYSDEAGNSKLIDKLNVILVDDEN